MTPDYWAQAKRTLSRRDPVLRKLIKQYPDAELGLRGDAFQTLARAIVGQQLSVKAAQTIWNRFAACAVDVRPQAVAGLTDEAMRACGFSGAKVRYVRDLARHFDEGRVHPQRWADMDDEAIIAELTQVKGLGRWSVEMFLIFHLMRPDVLPVDDLGLRRAMERQYNKGRPLTPEKMRKLGAAWAPWRSAATWYLWRSLDPVEF